MFSKVSLLSSLLAAGASAQQVGTLTTEKHPAMPIQSCTASGCTTLNTAVTLDANWRWLHSTSSAKNCYDGNKWDATLCPDNESCAANCALDGADYSSTYGVTASSGALTLKFVTQGSYSKNIGSRLYLMASESKYQMFKLLNKEFTFDVDTSRLPCGLNGALYLVEMDEDGGLSEFSGNKAGAKYGTGYCDTQCPHDIKFIDGEANSEGWTPNAGDANAGSGKYGACCHEMDLWEANSISAAYTPHVCSVDGPKRCSGTDCGDGDDRYKGLCDKDGCDFNSYRQGNRSFYGPGMKIDTKGKITVITQFVTNDGTDTGTLSEIRRKYVQNGVVIDNSVSTIPGVEGNSITDAYCSAQKTAFGDNNQFADLGGLKTMGAAIGRGMVLALSVWDDHSVNMLWLDSSYPPEKDPEAPGVARGSCSPDSGVPSKIEVDAADSQVIYSNIKFGAIGSTFKSGGAQPPVGSQPPVSSPTAKPTSSPTSKPTTSPTSKPTTSPTSKPTTSPTSKPTSAPTSTPTSSPGTGAALYAQCGGKNWQGPTTCTTGKCTVSNEYYSQCLP